MSDLALLVLAVLELLGLAGLFLYARARAKRRAAGEARPARAVRISVALLALAVVVGFPILMVTAIMNPATQADREREALMRSGTPATAVIIDLEETGTVINRRPEMRVYLGIEGASPSSATATWVFSVKDVQTYRVGTKVNVRVDPANRERAAVVGVAD